jgi:uncharacterized protein (DUF305 family)
MNKNIIIVGLVALILGTGIGYMINSVKHGSHDKGSYHDTKAPTAMEHTMSGMTASLNGKTGEALEIAFLEGMITHHEGAVAMAKELKAGTKRPELQKMADDIINAQTSEINTMKGWLNQWFGR